MESTLSDNLATLNLEMDAFIQKVKKIGVNDSLVGRLDLIKYQLSRDSSTTSDIDHLVTPSILMENIRGGVLRKFGWINVLEIIRNVLILVPIFFTWFSLSQASIAYLTTINKNPSLVEVPFLLQWENGFYGNLPNFVGWSPTFSHVAFLDAILIAVIIILTFIVIFNNQYLRQLA